MNNFLIAEDQDIKWVAINMMMKHISSTSCPVEFHVADGKDAAINETPVWIKGSRVKRLGLIIDADDDFNTTWIRVKGLCQRLNAQVSQPFLNQGLILSLGSQRFGVWIMPNHSDKGTVEDFCHDLVPNSASRLLQFAQKCTKQAIVDYEAPTPQRYLSKASLRTWLAWQQRPGENMGTAIKIGTLHYQSDSADAFASWFIKLFELENLTHNKTR